MSLGDVLLIFGLLLAHGVAMPGLVITWGLIFPRLVERSQTRLTQTPGRCFLLGLGTLVAGATLVRVAFVLGPVPGWFGLAVLLAFASLGAAGLAALMGERLRADGLAISSTGALLRGAVALELAVAVAVIGWFVILPLSTIAMLGAASFALLRRAPLAAATAPTPIMPVQLSTNPATWAETGVNHARHPS